MLNDLPCIRSWIATTVCGAVMLAIGATQASVDSTLAQAQSLPVTSWQNFAWGCTGLAALVSAALTAQTIWRRARETTAQRAIRHQAANEALVRQQRKGGG